MRKIKPPEVKELFIWKLSIKLAKTNYRFWNQFKAELS